MEDEHKPRMQETNPLVQGLCLSYSRSNEMHHLMPLLLAFFFLQLLLLMTTQEIQGPTLAPKVIFLVLALILVLIVDHRLFVFLISPFHIHAHTHTHALVLILKRFAKCAIKRQLAYTCYLLIKLLYGLWWYDRVSFPTRRNQDLDHWPHWYIS